VADFNITYLDTLPVLSVTLKDSSGAAIDLTNATNVKLHLLRYADANGEAVSGSTVITKTMTIASPTTSGVVTYSFVAADYGAAAILTGYYYLEFEINGPTTSKLTVPTPPTRYTMFVRDDLD
jgi:hypothetical protein